MEYRHRYRACSRTAGLLVAAVLIGAFAASASAEAVYIRLEELDPSALVIGTEISTEGQYAGRIGDNFALKNSSVIFVIESLSHIDVAFQRLSGESFLRVVGTVAYREVSNTHYISVTQVESTENLVARVMAAVSDPAADSASLLEISRAARDWAETHPNPRLLALAEVAVGKALKLEDIKLGPEDYEGYFELARKAKELLGETPLYNYYAREGVNAFIIVKGQRKAKTYYDAARKAESLLPDDVLSEMLIEKGFAIEKGLAAGASQIDYYALAAKAREIFGGGRPYLRLLAKGIDREYGRLAPGDFRGRYALAQKVRDIHPTYGNYSAIVTEALMAEKSSMDFADPDAWNRLGTKALLFLSDSYQAGFYFKEAFRLDTGNEEAGRKLRELGYVYYQGKWWRPEEFARSDLLENARRLEELAAAGEVAVGMTRAQIVTAKGDPARVETAAGGWGTTTQWIYEDEDELLCLSFIADMVIAQGRIPRE
jgi:hypothetical protein